jgi:hypothetical protein
MMVGYLELAQNLAWALGQPNFCLPTPSKPACCKTWIPWFPSQLNVKVEAFIIIILTLTDNAIEVS